MDKTQMDSRNEDSPGLGLRSAQVSLALVQLLDRLAEESRVPFDRTKARRAVDEAMEASPGPAESLASDWLATAARSIGLRVSLNRASLKDSAGLVQPRDPIAIIRPQAERPLLIMLAQSAGKVKIWDGGVQWVALDQLARDLGLNSIDDEIDTVLVEATEPYPTERSLHESATASGHPAGHGAEGGHQHGPTPLERLWGVMRTESSDLWVVTTFAIVVGLFSIATPIAVENLVNTVMFGNVIQPLIVLTLTLMAFLLASSVMRAVQAVVLEILQRRIFVRVVDDLSYRLPRVQQSELDGEYGPELVNRFFDTFNVQKYGTSLFLDGVTVTIQMIVGMTILGFYHPWLLGFDLLLVCLVAIVIFVIGRGGVRLAIDESRAKYHTAAWLQDLVRCPAAFRSAGAADFAFERADLLAKRYLDLRSRHFGLLIRQLVFVLVLEALASAILLGLGGWLVIQGQMTLGQLVAAEMIVTMIVGNIAKLGKHFETFFDLLSSLEKVGHLIDLPTEHTDGKYTLPTRVGVRVQISNVSYRFSSTHKGMGPIHGVIEPGEHVAITGPAGSGKSILLDMLYGTRVPETGFIRLDENDLRQLHLESVRRDVSLLRDVEIFDGTIAENVHMGRSEVLDSDVQRAIRAAGLDEELTALPTGLSTRLVRGTGSPLTSSQLRRLMVARALAGRPRMLLIDGLLDTLPSDMLDRVLPSLFAARDTMTILVVSSRREIVEACDRTVAMTAHADNSHGALAPVGDPS
jgi:ABC-type bacteriocin/lantibiotic exporter with double-glycine peptidase domain